MKFVVYINEISLKVSKTKWPDLCYIKSSLYCLTVTKPVKHGTSADNTLSKLILWSFLIIYRKLGM